MLKIIEKESRKLAVLFLSGDPLGEPDADLVRKTTRTIVQSKVRHLVFEMSDVRHINSAGLGGLVAALHTMSREGGTVQFASVGKNVQRVFAITRLVQVFDIVPTLDDAIKQWENATI